MKKSACLTQIVSFILGVVVVHFMWTGWGWLQNWLEGQGASSGVLLLGTLVFIPFTFGTITKLIVLTSMPKKTELVPTSVEDVTQVSTAQLKAEASKPLPDVIPSATPAVPLDAINLENASNELQAAGFVHLTDFRVKTSLALGFARLFVHHEHRCVAELHQVFPQGLGASVTYLTCVIISGMCEVGTQADVEDDGYWSLSTTNSLPNAGSGITWAWRRPRALWSRHPDWTPTQLLPHHLEKRSEMMRSLKLELATGVTWEEYKRSSARVHEAQRKRLLRRPDIMIWLENLTCRKKKEWWGDYGKLKSKIPQTATS